MAQGVSKVNCWPRAWYENNTVLRIALISAQEFPRPW